MGRVLALDVGQKRIGLAVSDPLGILALPLKTLERKGPKADLKALLKLIKEHDIERVIIGLPLNMSGALGTMAAMVQAFAAQLQQQCALPVEWVDERLTTVESQRVLQQLGKKAQQRKPLIDQVAAQLILQQYLESKRTQHADETTRE